MKNTVKHIKKSLSKSISLALLAGTFGMLMHSPLVQAQAANKVQASSSQSTPNQMSPKLVEEVFKYAVDNGIFEKSLEQVINKKRAEAEAQQRQALEAAANKVPAIDAKDHLYGKKDALITLYVYSDLECPYCARFANVPESIADKFNGKVNVVLRHFPLPFHEPAASKGAVAAECVAEQNEAGYYKFMNAYLMQKQKQYNQNERSPGLVDGSEDLYVKFAKEAGATNVDKFKACWTEGQANGSEKMKLIQRQVSGGQAAGINGTPATIIKNNKTKKGRLLSGALPADQFEQAINELLK